MSTEERDAWNARYAEGRYTPRAETSPLLMEWLPSIPVGRALDVACGTGRTALHLAEAGFHVDAVDISEVAIAAGREEAARRGIASIDWSVADLDEADLPGEGYDLITVLRYRNEALWPRLRAALAPNGWIFVDHHLQTSLDAGGPTNDEHRLAPGELLAAFQGFRILHYSERVEAADLGSNPQFVVARFVACAGDPGF